ncbi:MAG: DUF4232 domain-containing protein [Acidimicrobiales bacterium]
MVDRRSDRSGRLARGAQLALCVAAGALLLAACSSAKTASPVSGSTSTSAPAASTSAPTTTVPSPPAPSNSAPTTLAAAASCTSSALHLGEDVTKSSVGAGSADIAFTLTNRAATPCSVEGYPAVTFYGSVGGGSPLALTTRDTGQQPASVTVDAGGAAAFYLVVGNVPVGGVGCTAVRSIAVGLPPSGTPLPLAVSLDPCGGAVGVTALEPLSSLST